MRGEDAGDPIGCHIGAVDVEHHTFHHSGVVEAVPLMWIPRQIEQSRAKEPVLEFVVVYLGLKSMAQLREEFCRG